MGRNRNQKEIPKVARLLKARYQDFSHNNKRNPLNELLFIIASVKTTGPSYERTYRQFRYRYPTFGAVAEGPPKGLSKALASGGLQNIKAKSIKQIMNSITERFGRPTLSPLRKMTDSECEAFLTSLPGVGKKVARCVMMYSLDRKVFPVDTHCWLISRRLGWVKNQGVNAGATESQMDALQDMIPAKLRYSMHVNMVSLGREFCTYSNPGCAQCPINKLCRKIGVDRLQQKPRKRDEGK